MQNAALNLDTIAQEYKETTKGLARRIIICGGTGCMANGAKKVFNEFQRLLDENGLSPVVKVELDKEEQKGIHLSKSGCQGFCQMGPLVTIEPEGLLYTRVTADDVAEIVEKTLMNQEQVERLQYQDPATGKHFQGEHDIPFYTRQTRTVLKECGHLDPEDVNEYIAHGGYKAAFKAITMMEPVDVCNTVIESGLRGRGGGGFLTGKKWELTRIVENDEKYVICNGDEGDPGAFMDRSVMEGNPHAVIEGMMIAARATGANKGYVYVRTEYPLAVERVRSAVAVAEARGLLGRNLFGSGFNFTIEVMEGAGAFVCGEETALMASIEGMRGMPNPKPPFPSEKGLFGKPTVINNVETLASVPIIINQGPQAYRRMGTESSPGTKTFALTGHVNNTGLIEVPFGSTLREIVYNIGGGVTASGDNGAAQGFKAVQIGGPSGGCLTEDQVDLPLDYDSLSSIGAMVGSGGLVVMNQDTCIVQMAKFFMQFTQNESCGKCVLCREGTKQMLSLLNDIIEGNTTSETLVTLNSLAKAVKVGSLCGLGKSAPNPVLSMLNAFHDEFQAHVVDKTCPTRQCKALSKPQVIAENCKGCGLCKKACPVGAITGEKKQVHVIDEEKCINCGACLDSCRLKAIA